MTAIKYDSGKPRLDLIPLESLSGVAAVFEYGANKYSKDNWKNGLEYSRLLGATLRHLAAWQSGQDLDEESGLSHLDHAITSLLFINYYRTHNLGRDDR